ncbi:MAG: rod shape-determining protein MreC [Gammaproteobacteria bacterium]
MVRLTQNSKSLFSVEIAANIRVVLFVLVSIALMTLDHRYHSLEGLRNLLSTALYPLQYATQIPALLMTRVYQNFAERASLIEENERLRKQQLFIDAQVQKLTALEAENRRLRLLLDSSAAIRERVLIAELLAVDADPYRHQIQINKGLEQGVHIGQPLLDQHGVVGQVIHANNFTSTAILITDPNHALPVQINRNGLRTLAVGTGNYQELELPHVPNNQDVKVGDLLVTSGLGGRFPRGYPVAKITKVEFDPGHSFARIIAQPTAQLDRIREVLLVISEPVPEADSLPVGPFKQP